MKVIFEYVAIIGGGIGPDVWDTEIYTNAEDIFEAAKKFKKMISKMGKDAHCFVIEQVD